MCTPASRPPSRTSAPAGTRCARSARLQGILRTLCRPQPLRGADSAADATAGPLRCDARSASVYRPAPARRVSAHSQPRPTECGQPMSPIRFVPTGEGRSVGAAAKSTSGWAKPDRTGGRQRRLQPKRPNRPSALRASARVRIGACTAAVGTWPSALAGAHRPTAREPVRRSRWCRCYLALATPPLRFGGIRCVVHLAGQRRQQAVRCASGCGSKPNGQDRPNERTPVMVCERLRSACAVGLSPSSCAGDACRCCHAHRSVPSSSHTPLHVANARHSGQARQRSTAALALVCSGTARAMRDRATTNA
jgi:hypothetical protein